jgi:hypothetical protein
MMWTSPIVRFVGWRHAQASVVLRKAVQIIVMSVTVVTLPVFIELLRDGEFLACSGTVASSSRLASPKKRLT